MIKFEDRITGAFLNFQTGKFSKQDEVMTHSPADVSYYFCGYEIAKIEKGGLYLRDAGYQTIPTKIRLNAILLASPYPYSIYQKGLVWYISDHATKKMTDWKDGEVWNDITALSKEK